MELQDIIVYLIVFLCILYAGKNIFRRFRKKDSHLTGCCSGCSGCPSARKEGCMEHKERKNRQ